MTTARLIEHRITRNLLQYRENNAVAGRRRPVERLISVVAVSGGMLILGGVAPELLWALVAAAGVLTLGTRLS